MTVTPMRLDILGAIEEICEESISGYATPKGVWKELKRDPDSVKNMMHKLKKIGWLENPFWGAYKLSGEGRRVLEENRA